MLLNKCDQPATTQHSLYFNLIIRGSEINFLVRITNRRKKADDHECSFGVLKIETSVATLHLLNAVSCLDRAFCRMFDRSAVLA